MSSSRNSQSRTVSASNPARSTSKSGTPAPGDPGDPPTPTAFPIPLGVPAARKLLSSQKIIDAKDYVTPGLITLALTRIVALPGVPPAVIALVQAVALLLPETLEPIINTSQRLSAIENRLESPAVANASDPAELSGLVQKITELGEQLNTVKASSDAAEAVNLETQKLVLAAHEQGAWETVPPQKGARGPKPTAQEDGHSTPRGTIAAPSPRAEAAANRRVHTSGCRILVEALPNAPPPDESAKPLSGKELVQKAILAADAAWSTLSKTDYVKEKGKDTKPRLDFKNAMRLPRGGIIYEMGSREQASYLSDPQVAKEFEASYGVVTCKGQNPHILLERAPVSFNPTSESSLRSLEQENQLRKGEILSATWIKPEARRREAQEYAHLKIELRSEDAADDLIEFGGQIECCPAIFRRLSDDPTRCVKCQGFGHKKDKCKSAVDVCGQCGGDHWTKNCQNQGLTQCANCKVDSHPSYSRGCPIYQRERDRLNMRKPENNRRFFNPERQPAESHFPPLLPPAPTQHPLPARPTFDFNAPVVVHPEEEVSYIERFKYQAAGLPFAPGVRGRREDPPHRKNREGQSWDSPDLVTAPMATPMAAPRLPAAPPFGRAVRNIPSRTSFSLAAPSQPLATSSQPAPPVRPRADSVASMMSTVASE